MRDSDFKLKTLDFKLWEHPMAFIIDDILLSPLKLTVWLGKKLRESAYEEITDDSKIHEELLYLQMQYEMEEIDDETYEKEETKLMERLEDIRKMKEEIY